MASIAVLQRKAQMDSEELEAGHTRMIDYSSKLKMKKRSQNPGST